jgi:nucleoside-diphosphate kinase
MEKTLVLIKPDAVARMLVGKITDRFEQRGLQISDIYAIKATKDLIDAHYPHLTEKEYYPRILSWMTSGFLVAIEFAGVNAIAIAKQTIGATDPVNAAPGSIRGDFAHWVGANLVHASANTQDAEHELALWFPNTRYRRPELQT